jgi:hypothetical protein
MSEALQPRQRAKQGFSNSAIATLAFWQLRRTWFLLLFITLGTVAAVVIACAIPLLSNVMTTAGLRSTLRATPDIADIALNTGVDGISTPIVQNVYHQFDPLFHHYLGNTIQPAQFAITSEDFSLYPPRKNAVVTVYGTSMQQAAPHLGLIQGQLARITSNPSSIIETMMTPDTAQLLGVKVGSTFKLSLSYLVETSTTIFQRSAVLSIRVAGLFSVTPADAAYWRGEDFKTMKISLEEYTLLFPDDALLALFDQLRSSYHTDAIHSLNADGYSLIWHYRLDSSQLDSSKLDSLINQLAGVLAATDSQYGDLENAGSPATSPPYPYLMHVEITGQTFSFNGNPSVLEEFRSRIAVARIPTGVFFIIIQSHIRIFLNLMTTFLGFSKRETN